MINAFMIFITGINEKTVLFTENEPNIIIPVKRAGSAENISFAFCADFMLFEIIEINADIITLNMIIDNDDIIRQILFIIILSDLKIFCVIASEFVIEPDRIYEIVHKTPFSISIVNSAAIFPKYIFVLLAPKRKSISIVFLSFSPANKSFAKSVLPCDNKRINNIGDIIVLTVDDISAVFPFSFSKEQFIISGYDDFSVIIAYFSKSSPIFVAVNKDEQFEELYMKAILLSADDFIIKSISLFSSELKGLLPL